VDHRGTKRDQIERGEQAEDERKHKLHARLRRAFLGALTAPRSAQIRVCAQRLCNAGAVAVGLHENRHQRLDLFEAAASAELAKRFGARAAGADLVRDERKLLGELASGEPQFL
jgi:hypothetical protein